MRLDLVFHLHRQRGFSFEAFGPVERDHGIIEHIRKELIEIERDGVRSLGEWIDVIILGFDGAIRTGASPEVIARALVEKQTKNERRQWPDWRDAPAGAAIEHVRGIED